MTTTQFKLLFIALLLMQIAMILVCAKYIAEGYYIGIHAACIALNLLFGAVNVRNLLS